MVPTYKKGRREDRDNYRPVNLILVPGKVVEQINLSTITQEVQENQEVRTSLHGFMKGRSCLMKLISFWDKVTCLVDEGKAVDAVYLDLRKAFWLHHPTAFSWRNWLLMASVGVLHAGLELAGQPSPKRGSKWSDIQVTMAHKEWCSPGLSVGASPASELYQRSRQGD